MEEINIRIADYSQKFFNYYDKLDKFNKNNTNNNNNSNANANKNNNNANTNNNKYNSNGISHSNSNGKFKLGPNHQKSFRSKGVPLYVLCTLTKVYVKRLVYVM
jgi:hypothetical protein